MLTELIRGKEKIKETDRRNRKGFALFYLLPLVFEMMQGIIGKRRGLYKTGFFYSLVSRTWRKVMKVFALGGYGKVGFPAIKLFAKSDLVTEIAIVGRSLERAQKAATEIGEKAIVVHADGTDEEKLTSLLAGYDIIMNAAIDEAVLPSS
jgi:hypothetical protein